MVFARVTKFPLYASFFGLLFFACLKKGAEKAKTRAEGMFPAEEFLHIDDFYKNFSAMFPEATKEELAVLEGNFPKWWLASAGVQCSRSDTKGSFTGMFVHVSLSETLAAKIGKANYLSAGHVAMLADKCLLNRHFLSDRWGNPKETVDLEQRSPSGNLTTTFDLMASGNIEKVVGVRPEKFEFQKMFQVYKYNSLLRELHGFDVSMGNIQFGNFPTFSNWAKNLGLLSKEFSVEVPKVARVKKNDAVLAFCQSTQVQFPEESASQGERDVQVESEPISPSLQDPKVTTELNEWMNLSPRAFCEKKFSASAEGLSEDIEACEQNRLGLPDPKPRSKALSVKMSETSLIFGRVGAIGKVIFYADFDSRGGCSGSPVFSLASGDLVGVLTGGREETTSQSGEVKTLNNYFMGSTSVQIVSEES